MADQIDTLTIKDGISQPMHDAATAMNKAADAADKLEQSTTKAGRSATSFANSVDPVTRTTRNYEKAVRDLADAKVAFAAAADKGQPIAAREASTLAALQSKVDATRQSMIAARDGAAQLGDTHMALAKSSNAASFAVRDFGIQLIDVGQGIASGQPLFRTLIQQGAQVGQVMAVSNVSIGQMAAGVGRGLTSALTAALSPLGLAAAGVAGLGFVAVEAISRASDLDTAERALSVSLAATGRSADVSAASLSKYADQLKRAGASSADANALANALGRNQNLNSGQIGQIVGLVPDLSAALGSDFATAAGSLQSIAGGSVEALQRLNDALHILTPAQEAAATAALQHGDKLSALDTVVGALQGRIRGLNDEALSPAAKAIRNASNAWSSFVDEIANSEPALRIVQGFANTLNSLSGANSTVKDTAALAQLQGQASKIKTDLANIPEGLRNTDAGRDMQHQLDTVNQQIADIQKRLFVQSGGSSATLPGITVTAPRSASQVDQNSLDVARLAAQRASGSTAGQIAKYTDEISKFRAELGQLGPRTAENAKLFDNLTGAIGADQKAIDDLTKKNEAHRTGLEKQNDTLRAQIDAQHALAEAYGQGAAAVQRVQAAQDANAKAISDGLVPGTQKYAAAVADLTAKNLDLAQAKGVADLAHQIADTDAATRSQLAINAAYDGTATSLQHATDYQKAYNAALSAGLTEGTPEFTKAVDDYADALDRGAQAALSLAQSQASVNALASTFDQAFSSIGQAITNAFVSGQGAAVNFGNVAKGILAQIAQQAIQLAVLNPLKNDLFGQNNPTLGSAISTLNGGSSGGGLLSNVSGLGSLFGVSGGSISPTIDSLGTRFLPSIFGSPTLSAAEAGGMPGVAGAPGLLSGLGGFSSLSNVLGIGGAVLPGLMSGNVGQSLAGGAGAAIGTAIFPGFGTPLGGIRGNLLTE
jgi:hypothetical protein